MNIPLDHPFGMRLQFLVELSADGFQQKLRFSVFLLQEAVQLGTWFPVRKKLLKRLSDFFL